MSPVSVCSASSSYLGVADPESLPLPGVQTAAPLVRAALFLLSFPKQDPLMDFFPAIQKRASLPFFYLDAQLDRLAPLGLGDALSLPKLLLAEILQPCPPDPRLLRSSPWCIYRGFFYSTMSDSFLFHC